MPFFPPPDTSLVDIKPAICAVPVADQIMSMSGPLDCGEYGIVTIPPDLLAWAGQALSRAVAEHGTPVPYIYPTPDGYAQAEWTFHRIEASATFMPDGLLLFCCDVGHPGTYQSGKLHRDCDAAVEIAKFAEDSAATGAADSEARRRDFVMFGRTVNGGRS